VPDKPTTIIEELVAASRGVGAIIAGDKRAASYFDFSLRGLAGSFIAFLVVTAFSAYLPLVIGGADPALPTGRLLMMAGFLYAVQVGFSALVLRQINRLDGLVPYLVADNWATFFVTIASTIVGIFGPAANFMLVVAALLVLVIEINIARLIVTLNRWQIAMFLVAQIVGILIGLLIMGAIFPLPPDLVATPT
jgi:hypothetical protein